MKQPNLTGVKGGSLMPSPSEEKAKKLAAKRKRIERMEAQLKRIEELESKLKE